MKDYLFNLIKKIVKPIILFTRLFRLEYLWIIRCLKYNNWNKQKNTELYNLLIICHVLEKGLTMPNRRLGFGYDRVREVLSHCNHCIDKYGVNCIEIQAALNDLYEYSMVHKESNFELPKDIQNGLELILKRRSSKSLVNSYQFTNTSFFKPYSCFTEFAYSRHTCRHYSEKPVDLKTIGKCIKVAQTAPSACNRQSTRVYVIADENMKTIVRQYQNGSRGFGEYADKFLLITFDQNAWDIRQERSGFIDAGIFTMNLLYALHEEHIAACTLNAHFSSKQLYNFYNEIPINRNEMPVLFIAIGYAPESFSIARSERKNTSEIYTII